MVDRHPRATPRHIHLTAASFSGYMREDHSMKIKGNPLPPLGVDQEFRVEITERSLDGMTVRMTPREADPVQQAVDNYILMERKARAWDMLRENFKNADRGSLVDLMDSYVQSL